MTQKRVLRVAGEIPYCNEVNNSDTASIKACKELSQVIKIILEAFDEKSDNAYSECLTCRILNSARLHKNVLTFSFPSTVRKKLLLAKQYRVILTPGEPTLLLGNMAKHIAMINCTIVISGLDNKKQESNAYLNLRKSLLAKECYNCTGISIHKGFMAKVWSARIRFTDKSSVRLADKNMQHLLNDIKRLF